MIYYFTGALQTDSVKAQWKADQTPLCPFCEEVDSRPHRLLHCQPLQDVRDQFPDAVSLLTDMRDEWCYLPLARASPESDLVGLINSNFPERKDPKSVSVDLPSVTFFLDGGATHPQTPDARIAAWAVIQDVSKDDIERRVVADVTLAQPDVFPSFRTVAVGLVPGAQSVSRAELYALLVAVRAAHTLVNDPFVNFVTDCQFVVTSVESIVKFGSSFISGRTSHADLLLQLADLWDIRRFCISKVKSHVKFHPNMPLAKLWPIMGNACADFAVKETLRNLPESIQKLSRDILAWNTSEKLWLKHVCRFYLTVVRKRFDLAKLPENLNRHQSTNSSSEPGHLMPPRRSCLVVRLLSFYLPLMLPSINLLGMLQILRFRQLTCSKFFCKVHVCVWLSVNGARHCDGRQTFRLTTSVKQIGASCGLNYVPTSLWLLVAFFLLRFREWVPRLHLLISSRMRLSCAHGHVSLWLISLCACSDPLGRFTPSRGSSGSQPLTPTRLLLSNICSGMCRERVFRVAQLWPVSVKLWTI